MEKWDEVLLGEEQPPQPVAIVEKPAEKVMAKPAEKPKETHDAPSALTEARRQIAELEVKHAADPGGGYLENIKDLQEKIKKLEAHENAL